MAFGKQKKQEALNAAVAEARHTAMVCTSTAPTVWPDGEPTNAPQWIESVLAVAERALVRGDQGTHVTCMLIMMGFGRIDEVPATTFRTSGTVRSSQTLIWPSLV